MAAEGTAGRRVGEHPLADIPDTLQVIDRIEHGAGIEDGDDAIAAVSAAALMAGAFDSVDAPVGHHADLQRNVRLRAAAVGNEGFFPVDHRAHGAAGLSCEQCRDQFDIERLGAASETATDKWLHHPNVRHVHVEDLRQHKMHVIRHLRGGMHGHTPAHRVVFGNRGMHFHLDLAHLGAIGRRLAHEIGLREPLIDIAKLEKHVTLKIAGLLFMQIDGIFRQRRMRREIGGQFPYFEFDEPECFLRSGVVNRCNGCHRFATIAHPLARHRMLAAGNGQHAKGFVAVGSGDHRRNARQLKSFRYVDLEYFGMSIRAAVDAAGQHAGGKNVGGIFGAAGYLLRTVDHRHIAADIADRGALVHGALPSPLSSAACRTASMIFT